MSGAIRYLLKDDSNENAVLVPIRKWEMLNKRYQKLRSKYNILFGIQKSIKEMKQAEKQGIKLQTLDEFLSEYSCCQS
jgi:2-phospho-L-lactate guanylyltransferase (CobY/MobA/RfbA family)